MAGVVSVAVVASLIPEYQDGPPVGVRTAIAFASPSVAARRAGFVEPQFRVGCTRLLNCSANDRDSGSMTIVVPVKPVCPALIGLSSRPMYQRWSSSKPSPCELPGYAWL